MWCNVSFSVHANLFSFIFPNRWASFPTDSGHACQPSRKNHWHAAGDRQLWTAAHVGVSWISTFKSTPVSVFSPYVTACYMLHCQYSCVVSVAQVEEAVAVLQAHQAKKDATQKVGNMATTSASATSWRWCIGMKIHKMSVYSYLILWSYVIVVILIKWLWCFRSQKTEQRAGEIQPSLRLPVFSEQLCKKCEKKRKSLILKT